jgi:acyl carrier protein
VSAAALVEEIADLLCAVVGEDPAWRAALGPDTRLDGDLFLASIEFAALAAALRARYGARVDLAGYVAGLDLDALIGLTLDQVAQFTAERARTS